MASGKAFHSEGSTVYTCTRADITAVEFGVEECPVLVPVIVSVCACTLDRLLIVLLFSLLFFSGGLLLLFLAHFLVDTFLGVVILSYWIKMFVQTMVRL